MSSQQEQFEFLNEQNPEKTPESGPFHEIFPGWHDKFGMRLKSLTKLKSQVRTLSLFSGAGGLDIGFHDAGFKIIEKVENDQNCVRTLEANTGRGRYFDDGSAIFSEDVRNYQTKGTDIDFIIGGPPCQPFSAAGARANGVSGTRTDDGKLFLEYVRILSKIRPKGFLFENVYRILGSNKGEDWKQIQQEFQNVGYQLHYLVLDVADYGVPQHRERLIIVGIRADIESSSNYKFPKPTHGPDSDLKIPHFSAGSSIVDLPRNLTNQGLNGRYGNLLSDIPPGLNYSFFTEKMGHPKPIFAWRSKFSDFLYKADPNRPVRTLKAQGGQYTGPFHWDSRPFLIDELKRLQTFPDIYEITGGRSSVIKQIGNSVPPHFARMLALSILDQVFGAAPIPQISYLEKKDILTFRKRKRELTEYYAQLARTELQNLKPKKSGKINVIGYSADLLENHSWTTNKQGSFRVRESIQKNGLRITVCQGNIQTDEDGVIITINPKINWSLPVGSIDITLDHYSDRAFLAGWKALDFFLMREEYKADLVQLSGYYQYESKIKITTIIKGDDPFIRFLKNILSGKCINKSLKILEWSDQFELNKQQIETFLLRLKCMGYEVRSAKTNLAIDDNKFLVPYAFPTLTDQSVQRLKTLL